MVVTGMTFFEEMKEIDKFIETANRKDDDMTIEELHEQTNSSLVGIIERLVALEVLSDRVANLNLGDTFSRLDSKVDRAIGRLDAMDQVNASFYGKIEELFDKLDTMTERMEAWRIGTDAAIDILQAEKKIADEMRGDVALCKSGIRDLDAIRDAFARSAKGFSERIDRVEESVAAFQTLRHHDDDPQAVPTTAIEPAASDPAGSPGVDNMA